VVSINTQLKLLASAGKRYLTDFTDKNTNFKGRLKKQSPHWMQALFHLDSLVDWFSGNFRYSFSLVYLNSGFFFCRVLFFF
jgi:hypothetical protein